MVAYGFISLGYCTNAAYIYTDRRVVFESASARGGLGRPLRISAYHGTQLVDEYNRRVGLADVCRKHAQGLRHEPCLQSHVRVSDISVYLAFGSKGRYRIHDENVYGSRAHERVSNCKCLLSRIRL